MNKKILVLIFAIFFSVIGAGIFVNAVCCEKTTKGAWCQDVADQKDCASSLRAAPTSCSSTIYCQLGTCIDVDKGSCTGNTPKVRCETEGGIWDAKPKDEIPMCGNGCCILEDKVAFVTNTECKQLASDYGLNVQFRADISDEGECFKLSSPKKRGACVSEKDYSKECVMLTKEECIANPDAEFSEGMLCTASGLSNCAKSGETTCYREKVYFLDTCKNIANVFDEDMFTKNENSWTKEMEDYWTYIQEPKCAVTGADGTCGDCSYRLGTLCKDYKKGEMNMPAQPKFGEKVCAELSCYYDNEGSNKKGGGKIKYEHGESWCANSDAIIQQMPVEEDENTRVKAKKYETYNLPGSRYYKLQCWEGEVIETPCRDFRNEVCKQDEINDYKIAECIVNDWRGCFTSTSKEECEDGEHDCQWVYGYRFDGQILLNEENQINSSNQGSCVPLYSPGFNFWEANSDGNAICTRASVSENALYETWWGKQRDEFEGDPVEERAKRCIDRCYAIPTYGENGVVSKREGYYCLKNPDKDPFDPANWKTGKESGAEAGNINCGSLVASEKASEIRDPLFDTHNDWLNSLTARARLLGDCGYKENLIGEKGQGGSELITAIFQKLNQKGEPKQGKNNTVAETIYTGADIDTKLLGRRNA